jgi:hypothetical protein
LRAGLGNALVGDGDAHSVVIGAAVHF